MEKKELLTTFPISSPIKDLPTHKTTENSSKKKLNTQHLIIVVNFKDKAWKECFDFNNGHLGICAGASNPGSAKII